MCMGVFRGCKNKSAFVARVQDNSILTNHIYKKKKESRLSLNRFRKHPIKFNSCYANKHQVANKTPVTKDTEKDRENPRDVISEKEIS